MVVDPDVFVSAMRSRWANELKNTSSPALESVWRQLAEAFNAQTVAAGTPDAGRWKVLQPATGTGKTQGLALYCSLLPEASHSGVLIVTRLKNEADDLAKTINTLGGRSSAVAYHGGTKASTPAETLSSWPVVVVTHKAFQLGLDALSRGHRGTAAWEAFHKWQSGTRALIVIDEALDVVEESQVDVDQVRRVRGLIPFDVEQRFPSEVKTIETVETVLMDLAKEEVGGSLERMLDRSNLSLPDSFDLDALRQALRGCRLDRSLLGRNDLEQNRRLLRGVDDTLKATQATLATWSWYRKHQGKHSLNTARMIVPKTSVTGGIILDATASSNVIYALFENRADVIAPPANARTYQNVSLHVASGFSVGKGTMVKKGKALVGRVMQSLQAQLDPSRRLLMVCHKLAEAHAKAFAPNFAAFEVAHWNAIDGRNDWKDFDAVVICGLPYRDPKWAANTFMAIQGPQTTSWLQSPGDRPWGGHGDIRRALQEGQLVVSVIQAVNRIRCRRVIDAAGNCPKADVFLLLPGNQTGSAIVRGIGMEMPGIRGVRWSLGEGGTAVPRTNHAAALTAYARSMMPGRVAFSEARLEIGMSRRSGQRLQGALSNRSSDLSKDLRRVGCQYSVEPAGKTRRAYLTKADAPETLDPD